METTTRRQRATQIKTTRTLVTEAEQALKAATTEYLKAVAADIAAKFAAFGRLEERMGSSGLVSTWEREFSWDAVRATKDDPAANRELLEFINADLKERGSKWGIFLRGSYGEKPARIQRDIWLGPFEDNG